MGIQFLTVAALATSFALKSLSSWLQLTLKVYSRSTSEVVWLSDTLHLPVLSVGGVFLFSFQATPRCISFTCPTSPRTVLHQPWGLALSNYWSLGPIELYHLSFQMPYSIVPDVFVAFGEQPIWLLPERALGEPLGIGQ